jgi:hypothetical protein
MLADADLVFVGAFLCLSWKFHIEEKTSLGVISSLSLASMFTMAQKWNPKTRQK